MSAAPDAQARRASAERRYLRAATIAALGLVLATVAVFLKDNPFASGYELRGIFSSANQLKSGDEVRIAGLRVGEVTEIAPGPRGTSLVTIEVESAGRPIHSDATLAIEPRLILEGNLYVSVRPGTPNAPELRSGAVIPRSRTTTPVQLDQVLGVLDLPTRGALHRSISELAAGLGPAQPARGRSARARPAGHRGLRRAVRELDGALGDVETVARAARGTRAGDLGRAVGSSRDFAGQLAEDPRALADIVTNFERVSGALAERDRALAATVRGFRNVLRVAPPSLSALDGSLPALTRFGNSLRPVLRSAPATLGKTNRLLAQIDAIVEPGELPALLGELGPLTARLPTLERRLGGLLPSVTSFSRCLSTRVVPTLNMRIEDGPNTTGDPVWLDLMHAFTALTGASPNFDGNATTIRLGVTQGESSINGLLPGLGVVAGGGPEIQGVRPTWLGYGVDPPYRPDQSCTDQALPDLTKRSGLAPDWPMSGAARPGTGGRP